MGDAHSRAQRTVFDDFELPGIGDVFLIVLEIGVDIPGIPANRAILVLLVDNDSVFSAGAVNSYTSSGINGDK
ncbi:MAG: hypothetical protein AAF647_12970, partial [Pseudomonadota bacterium]